MKFINNTFNTSSAESVGKGHSDKICDQIADKILDICLSKDANAKVACEVVASNHLILIAGEITTCGYVDMVQAAWEVLLALNYNENDFSIILNVNKQSNDIAQSVFKDPNHITAGDQGIVYGYACNETKSMLPLAFVLATELIHYATNLIISKKILWAKYDMKSLVNLKWIDKKPILESVIFSIQHDQKISLIDLKKEVETKIFNPVLIEKFKLNTNFQKLINTSGKFTIGGPVADTGLTNRKLMVDSYGSIGLHGGGGFSGKDPSKVDRSGAYLARWIAKNLVAANLCNQVEVKLVYALGISEPINISVKYDQSKYNQDQLIDAIKNVFCLNLSKVINQLKLLKFKYFDLSTYGHFGREDLNCEWEKTNKKKALLIYLEKQYGKH